ncbi:MAG: preprotein translocase subunit SecG [Candidatus Brocadiae bacterium]|nr:preprotein translocase subunit SecG [Candidatus Brocadiia bacterium]
MTLLVTLLTVVFVLACVFLVMLVLIQPPHSDGTGGLAGAFMGGGGDSFLGTRAMSMAGKVTIVLSVLIVALAITINKIGPSKSSGSIMEGKGDPKPPAEAPADK